MAEGPRSLAFRRLREPSAPAYATYIALVLQHDGCIKTYGAGGIVRGCGATACKGCGRERGVDCTTANLGPVVQSKICRWPCGFDSVADALR